MDLKEIKRLIQLVESSQISHFSIEEEGVKVEIKKELAGPAQSTQSYVLPQMTAPQAGVAPSPVEAAPAVEENDPSLIAVKAQMVGTYYASPNPESSPYVKVGDKISKGSVVCIIEAMKLFNEIEAEISGTIEKVCVDNAAPVEYGQDLFLVRVE
jgi:acetyl-CoA carboxylase biotin carboxyl carrier protein